MSTAPSRPAPLFVGDHLAMDFLNSTATPDGDVVEWLATGADLIDWLEQAGALDPDVARQFREQADGAALDRIAVEARALRDWFRGFVLDHEGRELGLVTAAALAPLNEVLARDESHLVIEPHAGHLHARRVRRWTADLLLQPIAEAMVDLISHADFRLVRACEGNACTLIFLDKTKAHRRRWCSMGACGNRAKVAAHRARAAQGAAAS